MGSIELGLLTRVAGVPVVVGRLRDPELLKAVAQAIVKRGLRSANVSERHQAVVIGRLLRQSGVAVRPPKVRDGRARGALLC